MSPYRVRGRVGRTKRARNTDGAGKGLCGGVGGVGGEEGGGRSQ